MNRRSIVGKVQGGLTDIAVAVLRPFVTTYLRIRKRSKKKVPAKKVGGYTARLKEETRKRPYLLRFGTQDQIFFAKRLGMILKAGMPIMEGLHMMSSETRSGSARHIFQSITVDVSEGQPLSAGLGKFQTIFGDFCINIVRVGETSGTLYENLDYLAEELKKKQALRRKVLGALVYPAVIILATIGITVMLTVFIFPKIIPIFKSVKATLPLSTRMLIAISGFLGTWGWHLLGGVVILGITFFLLVRFVPKCHLWTDIILLRIPLLGKLSQNYNLANSARTLSLLLKSDVGIVRSMELVAASTKNQAYRKAFQAAEIRIIRGQKLSEQFKASPELFPTLMTQMVHVGESTGNLSSSLMFLSDMYEEEIGELTKNLTTMLEPILMIIMGLVVGFIAISIITPIYSITQSLTPK
jgi:type II secretory pathway component PulF